MNSSNTALHRTAVLHSNYPNSSLHTVLLLQISNEAGEKEISVEGEKERVLKQK